MQLMRRPGPPSLHRRRGIGLLDALIAMSMLAFGMLGLTRMQARLIANNSDAQVRLAATRAADELLGMAQLDGSNAACYTLPATGVCTSSDAAASAAQWKTAALAALPTHAGVAPSAVATLDSSTGRLQLVLSWSGKPSQIGSQLATDTHTLTAVTDVRQ